jgi:hypothetical protein
MIGRRLSCFLLALSTAALATGCATGFVEQAARGSVASFLTEVLTTAVDGAVNP